MYKGELFDANIGCFVLSHCAYLHTNMQHKAVILGIIILFSSKLYSQKAELFGGYHIPLFLTSETQEAKDINVSNGHGYSLGLGFHDVMIQKNPVQFIFRFTSSSSDWNYTTTEDQLFRKYDVELLIQSLEIEVFPINIKALDKKLNIGLGSAFEFIQSDEYQGTVEIFDSVSFEKVNGESYGNLVQFNFGLSANVSYEITIAEGVFLTPRYSFSMGLTNLTNSKLPIEAKRIRHLLELGIRAYLD